VLNSSEEQSFKGVVMKKRIQELLSSSRPNPSDCSVLTPDLSERIFQDVQQRRLYTYEQAAELIGCDPETIRIHARGFPVIRRSKPHRIPACVLDLIIRTKIIAA
jgi:hypothetical protein